MKRRMLVENEVTAYYNMTETRNSAFAAAPTSLLIENGEGVVKPPRPDRQHQSQTVYIQLA